MRWRIEINSAKNDSWHHSATSITLLDKCFFARYCEEFSNILTTEWARKMGKCTKNANIHSYIYVSIILRAK